MESYQTKYGVLHGISEVSLFQNGNLKECVLNDKVELNTKYGILIPQHDFSNQRKKNNYCISFYESGALRRIALDHKTDILTSIGTMSAELITFYESGSIKRLFPLNGLLSAYWEENDEYQLAEEMSFEFSFGNFKTKMIAISFYEEGNVKDLTLWPKEEIKLSSTLGECSVRIGFSLYPDGALKSLEPAIPIQVKTSIGDFFAYDTDASGISGDKNSLIFDSDGIVKSFLTSTLKVVVYDKEGHTHIYSPNQEVDVDGLETAFFPLAIELTQKTIIFNNEAEYAIDQYKFKVLPYFKKGKNQCSDCSSCGGCGN